MNTDNSVASFWNAFPLGEITAKLLIGRTVPLALGPTSDASPADEIAEPTLLEVVEYHQ